MDALAPLLGRTMVVTAHADDEVIGCGALLQRMRDPLLVISTDGAPRDDYFWRRHGSREAYAQIRKQEASRALPEAGVRKFIFLAERNNIFVDQELFRVLPQAFAALFEIARQHRPQRFQGRVGHVIRAQAVGPDHEPDRRAVRRLPRPHGGLPAGDQHADCLAQRGAPHAGGERSSAASHTGRIAAQTANAGGL